MANGKVSKGEWKRRGREWRREREERTIEGDSVGRAGEQRQRSGVIATAAKGGGMSIGRLLAVMRTIAVAADASRAP